MSVERHFKIVRTDGTSHGGFQWPLPTDGNAVEVVAADPTEHDSPCPQHEGDGLCVALSARGASSGGIGLASCIGLLLDVDPADILARDSHKMRVARVLVVGVFDVLDVIRSGLAPDPSGANLSDADLRSASLRGAYLRGANLRGANLYGANLRSADLDGANLRGANLRGAYLDGAYLYGANLDGADLDGANLRGANLDGANLSGANLSGANLRSADLDGANLRGANLRGAYLDGAYLYGANLDGAYLRGAYGRDDWSDLIARGAIR